MKHTLNQSPLDIWKNRSMDQIHVARRKFVAGGMATLASLAVLIPAAVKGDNLLWDKVAVCSAPVKSDDSGKIGPREVDDASASVGYPLTANYEDYADGVYSNAAIALAKKATEIGQSDSEVRICVNAGRGIFQRDFNNGGAMSILDSPYASAGLPDGEIVTETTSRTIVDIVG